MSTNCTKFPGGEQLRESKKSRSSTTHSFLKEDEVRVERFEESTEVEGFGLTS